jgi:hypothetical protein
MFLINIRDVVSVIPDTSGIIIIRLPVTGAEHALMGQLDKTQGRNYVPPPIANFGTKSLHYRLNFSVIPIGKVPHFGQLFR